MMFKQEDDQMENEKTGEGAAQVTVEEPPVTRAEFEFLKFQLENLRSQLFSLHGRRAA